MFHYIAALYKRASDDSSVHAVVDWITYGCYTGFRKSEWCSDHHDSFATIDNPHWGHRPSALPVIGRLHIQHRIRAPATRPGVIARQRRRLHFTLLPKAKEQ